MTSKIMKGLLYRIRWIWEDLLEKLRKKASEPRIWIRRPGEVLHEETCEYKIDKILVHSGLAKSRTEAQRLLSSGSVEIRDFFCFDPWEKIGLKDSIPKQQPLLLRTGKKLYGLVVVMLPENQSLIFWRSETENFL